jgi:hypothetical protein
MGGRCVGVCLLVVTRASRSGCDIWHTRFTGRNTRHTFIRETSESEPDESESCVCVAWRESIKASRDCLPLPFEVDAVRLFGARMYSSVATSGVFDFWSDMTDAPCRMRAGRGWRVVAVAEDGVVYGG